LKRPIPYETGTTYKKRRIAPTLIDADEDDFSIMDEKFYQSRGWVNKEYDEKVFTPVYNSLLIKKFPLFQNQLDYHAYRSACYQLCVLANEWTTDVICSSCETVLDTFPSMFKGDIKCHQRHCFFCPLLVDEGDKRKAYYYKRIDYWAHYMLRIKKKGEPKVINYTAELK
jgi:hypothetical protein